MTIHASGSSISATQILAEVNVASPTSGSWLAAEAKLRELVGIPSGQVKFSDFYSKSVFQSLVAGPSSLAGTGLSAVGLALKNPNPNTTPTAFNHGYFLAATGAQTQYDYTDPAKTNLYAAMMAGQVEVMLHLVSAPSGGGGTPQYQSNYFNGATSTAYVDGTWMTLPSPSAQINMQYNFLAPTGTWTWQMQIGIRWAGNAASQTLKTITCTLTP